MRVLCRRPCLAQSQFLCPSTAQALSLQHQSCLWSLTQPRHMCASPSASEQYSPHECLAVCHPPIPSTSGPHLQTGRGRQSHAWLSAACPPALAGRWYSTVGLCLALHDLLCLLTPHQAPHSMPSGGALGCMAAGRAALTTHQQNRPQPGSLRIPTAQPHLPIPANKHPPAGQTQAPGHHARGTAPASRGTAGCPAGAPPHPVPLP